MIITSRTNSIYGIHLYPLQTIDLLNEKNNEIKNKKIKTLINDLPYELQKSIFDYLKIELWYEEFQKDLQLHISKKLNIYKIRPWIPHILSNQKFTEYCIQKDKNSEYIWEDTKIKNKKHFSLLNKGDSFALSLLFIHYH
jgi:hypothetical protein